MTPQELRERTTRFALSVLKLFRSLSGKPEARTWGNQLLDAAGSVGANYRAVCVARSRPDFVNKLRLVLEEADEAAYWLELLLLGGLAREAEAQPLLQEAKELSAIFAASVRTAREGSGWDMSRRPIAEEAVRRILPPCQGGAGDSSPA